MRKRWRTTRARDLAGLALTLWWACAAADATDRRVDAVVETVRAIESCVVNISTDREVVDPFFRNFAPFFGGAPTRRVRSSGSGVIFHEDGYVLTNLHVVRGADRIVVLLLGGRKCPARRVAADPAVDLAVLDLDGEFSRAKFASSDVLYVGETVIAMGNPFGLTNSVSRGVLSAVGREIQPRGSRAIKDLLQTDAAINPGNSGGPLVNMDAEVIGLNTAMQAGAENIGFATSVRTIKQFLLDRVADPRTGPGYTGLRVRLDGDAVVVDAVERSSSAARAGVKAGDVLVRVGTHKVANVADYFAAFFAAPEGQPLPIVVTRAGKEVKVTLEPSAFDAGDIILRRLGLVVRDLDGNTDTLFDETNFAGVLVLRVERDSPADDAEIDPGDAIISADGEKIAGADDLASHAVGKTEGDVILVEALRLERSGPRSVMIRSAKRGIRLQ